MRQSIRRIGLSVCCSLLKNISCLSSIRYDTALGSCWHASHKVMLLLCRYTYTTSSQSVTKRTSYVRSCLWRSSSRQRSTASTDSLSTSVTGRTSRQASQSEFFSPSTWYRLMTNISNLLSRLACPSPLQWYTVSQKPGHQLMALTSSNLKQIFEILPPLDRLLVQRICLRCGGKYCTSFIENLTVLLVVKEFWKSIKILQS